jgi:hypothetical protein
MDSRSICILVGLLVATMALADGAYKWTDEDGVVHYSDVPRNGAEVVDLAQYSKTTGARIMPSRPTTPGSEDDSEIAKPEFRYESLSISDPGAEETLWNIAGVLSVTVNVSPALQSGHQLRAYFDGNMRTVRGTFFEIEEVYRGVHNLQVEIIDATGKLMIRSKTNRFYVQQNSVRF